MGRGLPEWVESILDLFRARPAGGGRWKALCPAHDDRRPSLSLWFGLQGQLMFGCWAGCPKSEILGVVGLKMSQLYPPKEGQTVRLPRRRIVACYDYRDADGKLAYQAVRYEPKDFRQRRWVGPDAAEGGWVWDLVGVTRVLYSLPELLAEPARPVVVVEGERCADHLNELDVLATCNVGGAGKWLDSYSETLAGRRVAVLPDADEAGERHAHLVAGSLLAHGATVRLVRLPGLPPKGDCVDWLRRGGTREELVRLINQTPEWAPAWVEAWQ